MIEQPSSLRRNARPFPSPLTGRAEPVLVSESASTWAFFRRVTLPIIVLIVLLVALVGAGITWDVKRSNAALMNRQMRSARIAVSDSVDVLAYQQQSVAMWREMVNKVQAPTLDLAWLDENCGGWLHQMFGHDWVILIDPQDRVVYVSSEGERVALNRARAILPAIGHLIDGARGRFSDGLGAHDRRIDGRALTTTTALTQATAVHESDLALIGSRPAAASAMRVRTIATDKAKTIDTGYILIDIRFLDGPYLGQLSRRNLLAGLHFALTDKVEVEDEHAFPLFNGDDKQIGYFHWTPELPGGHILTVMLPGALLGLALLVAALVFLERSLRHAAGSLTSSLAELEQRNGELETERLIAKTAEADREDALRREALHFEREREALALRHYEDSRRADLLAVAASFEASVMGVVGSLGTAAEQLAASAISLEDMSAESQEQTGKAVQRIRQVSQAASTVADGVGLLSRSITQISERADQQADLSGRALSNTRSGADAMWQLVERAEGIAAFTNRIAAIASQTNLLALNATIEAARAGTSGLGFAVVAAEIKTLARQAASANGEIDSLITAIRGSADIARAAFRDVSTAVGDFASSADAVHSSVSSQRAAAEAIDRSASGTAHDAGSLAQQIMRVAEVARDAGNLSGQVSGAANSLLEDAMLMRTATQDFLAMLRTSSGQAAQS